MRVVAFFGLVIALAVSVLPAPAGASDGNEPIRTASVLPAIAIPDPRLVLPAPSPDLPPELKPTPNPSVPAPLPKRYETLTITLGGDLGLSPSDQPVIADHVLRHGQRYSFAEITRGLAGHLTADIVLANLETVVTARNDLSALEKAFNFRTHPNAVRHLVASGFNVLTVANNHTYDYGDAGLVDTIRHLEALSAHGLRAAPGAGFGRSSATAAADISLSHARVRVGAAGIGGGVGFGGERATMASYHGGDFNEVVRQLRDAPGDVRILSVHFGQEQSVQPSLADQKKLRDAVASATIDLVAGHHAHVAAGIQEIDGRYIFYGLGNLLHPGMQDMGKYGVCRDFGILATVHYGRSSGEAYEVRAIEVRTLADMHASVRVRAGEDARARVAILNFHATGLDDRSGDARGVRFASHADGSGLYCTARAGDHDDALAARCAVASSPQVATAAQVASCGRGDLIARRGGDALLSVSARHTSAPAPSFGSALSWRLPVNER